jgi:hypothetical protein
VKSSLPFLQLIDPTFTSRYRKQSGPPLRLAVFLKVTSISLLVLTETKPHYWNLSFYSLIAILFILLDSRGNYAKADVQIIA